MPPEEGSPGASALRRWAFRLALALLSLLVCFALFTPLVTPSPTAIDLDVLRAVGPSWTHPAGTDSLGRDNLARLADGSRTSLGIGALAGMAAVFVLVGVGASTSFGTRRPRRRAAVSLVVGLSGVAALVLTIAALPVLRDLWLIYLVVLQDALIVVLIFLALGLHSVYRATALREETLRPALGNATLAALPWALGVAAVAIAYESKLSFFGFGVNPPQATLGNMLGESREGTFSLSGEWWLSIPPLVLIVIAIGALLLIAISAPRPGEQRIKGRVDRRVRAAALIATTVVVAFVAIEAARVLSWPSFDTEDAQRPQRVNTTGPAIEEEESEPPHDVLPALVPFEPIICRSDEVAVQIRNIRACDKGWTFEVVARSKRSQEIIEDQDSYAEMDDGKNGSLDDRLLRFRFIYPDGREFDNVDGRYVHFTFGTSEASEAMSLSWGDSGGSDGDYYWTYTATPLPPPGSIRIDCEWPALGVEETRTHLNATEIRKSASKAIQLWP